MSGAGAVQDNTVAHHDDIEEEECDHNHRSHHHHGVPNDLHIQIDPSTTAVILPPPTTALKGSAGAGFVSAVRYWYISNYCSEYSVNQLLWVQSLCTDEKKIRWLSMYFNLWSEMGNQLFYTLMIPVFVWSGWEEAGFQLCVMLSLGLYITDAIKDVFACPRPPSPPVRRGGTASHGLEYGLPSTHTCCACILAREMCYFLGKCYPDAQMYFNIFGIVFVLHVAFSRMFLGLHWLADIVAGFVCFVFLTLLEVAFLRNLLAYMTYQFKEWPIILPIAIGYLMLVVHPAPVDPCPCYEDSVRFIGVDVGSLVGIWFRRRAQVSIERLPLNSVLSYVFSWGFVGKYVIGLVVVVIVKTGCGYAVPRVLHSSCSYLSGRAMVGSSSYGPHTVKGKLYRFVCCCAGLLLARRPSWSPNVSQLSCDTSRSNDNLSEVGGNGSMAVGMSDAIRVVVEDFTGSPQLTNPPPLPFPPLSNIPNTNPSTTHIKNSFGPSSSNPRAAASSNSSGRPSPTNNNVEESGGRCGVGSEEGVYWSLRTHNHWYIHDILTKYLNYMMTGIAVAFFAPLICQRFFYDPVSDLWIV